MSGQYGSPAPRRGFALRPEGLIAGQAAMRAQQAGTALPLVGGPLAFSACEVVAEAGRVVLPVAEARAWAAKSGLGDEMAAAIARVTARRAPFAGLTLDRPRLMGVVNVTPDSFSDGGDFADTETAIAHGLALRDAGADILDIGGESTRPGSEPLPVETELARVLPVIQALARASALVSVDTRRARVMGEAIAAGARIVNDITALAGDPESLGLVARTSVSAVLMHMQGEPRSMQANPVYVEAPLDIRDFFVERLAAAAAAGIPAERIAIDPGIGFGKNDRHNIAILQGLGFYHELGVPILLGVSRKSFIGRLSRKEPAKQRLAGSLAGGLAGLDRGVQILRVHDVAETRQAMAVWQALVRPVSSAP
jgi:dihydropteroate synthase